MTETPIKGFNIIYGVGGTVTNDTATLIYKENGGGTTKLFNGSRGTDSYGIYQSNLGKADDILYNSSAISFASCIDMIINTFMQNAGQIELLGRPTGAKWTMGISQDGVDLTEEYLAGTYDPDFTDNSAFFVWFHLNGSDENWSNDNDTSGIPNGGGYTGGGVLCRLNDGIYWRWDGVDDLDIYINDTWYEMASGIATQGDVETFFETIYPDDNYDYAYDTTTGEICAKWTGDNTGSGTWSFSTTIEEELALGDDVTALVQRNRQEYKKKWL